VDLSPELVHGVLPATAHIVARVPASHPSAAILGTERMGSGVVIDAAGLVLTVNYVVMGARRVRVTLPDGRRAPAAVAAQDFESGLALLRVAARDLPAATLGSSAGLARGAPVFAVAAVGPRERRVAGGLVADLGPFDAYWEYLLDRGVVTTAANPGFGGGALFDTRGVVVALVSLNLNEVLRQSLAVPVECFTRHRDELVRHGRVVSRPRRAWLGIFPQPVGDELVVVGLVPDGPAERGGLQEGDVIVRVDEEAVDSRPALYAALWRHRPGDRLVLEVRRDSRLRRVEVVGEDRADFYGIGRERPDPRGGEEERGGGPGAAR
jgi:S1-C subfamily serine protease